MLIVCLADDPHEMSSLIFSKLGTLTLSMLAKISTDIILKYFLWLLSENSLWYFMQIETLETICMKWQNF